VVGGSLESKTLLIKKSNIGPLNWDTNAGDTEGVVGVKAFKERSMHPKKVRISVFEADLSKNPKESKKRSVLLDKVLTREDIVVLIIDS
jgi:hypothetical protein